jgi:hypothetical protein
MRRQREQEGNVGMQASNVVLLERVPQFTESGGSIFRVHDELGNHRIVVDLVVFESSTQKSEEAYLNFISGDETRL